MFVLGPIWTVDTEPNSPQWTWLDTIADLQSMPALLRTRSYTGEDIEGIIWRNRVEFLRRAWKENGRSVPRMHPMSRF